MKRIVNGLALAAGVFASTLTWAGVNVDWDKATSFGAYRTYAWGTGTPAKNPLWDQRVVEGVDQRLSARGFHKVDPNEKTQTSLLCTMRRSGRKSS